MGSDEGRNSIKPFQSDGSPVWTHKHTSDPAEAREFRRRLQVAGLRSACNEGHCPNLTDCFSRATAAIVALGQLCTRTCEFCSAGGYGHPERMDLNAVEQEPEALAEAAAELGLRHVVVACVCRDDLPDGGASRVAMMIHALRARLPQAVIEILTGDLKGDASALQTVLAARPDILNHNIQTVRRLYLMYRPEADYDRSLTLLERAGQWARENIGGEGSTVRMRIKSGLMMGLGERRQEVLEAMSDLRKTSCQILTLGQYFRPTTDHLPVERYVEPEEFEQLRLKALKMGFETVAAGPVVRSSYHADDLIQSRRPLP